MPEVAEQTKATARILVVEDEYIVARDIQNRLRRFGYSIAGFASSGEDAVAKAEETAPDLVLMDIMLKGEMDGTEAADRIRMRLNIPVVYLTAYADDATVHRAKLTEPFGYILKPFEERELQTTIEMALYKHRAEGALRRARDELEVRVEERTADLRRINERLMKEIEERRRTEDALRKSEAQLLQSQKMEAVGRLASGVAHDFNNNLAVIMGYLDLSLEAVPGGTPLEHNLKRVMDATRRSAGLTKQLLLFSNNQPMDRQPLDLNGRVADLKKMLGRLLGENIVVELDLAEELWLVQADPVNLDQVVTNLAVNARDAMPEGGRLCIQTACVEPGANLRPSQPDSRPGRFVRLTVSDTGVGMDEKVMARLFEPFFTTKAPDKGTGLGLSVVYGIVQSHKGWIDVESRPGAGSRFDIYLPALNRSSAGGEDDAPICLRGALRGKGESVLLLEDEPQLRELLVRIFSEKGYRVQAFETCAAAERAFREAETPFDLFLSDVVLPDGKGTNLVLKMLAVHPRMKAILMTGYPDQREEWERIRQAGLPLLQKPVGVAELLERVREAFRVE